eukprot:scpid28965/ scgid10549/ 
MSSMDGLGNSKVGEPAAAVCSPSCGRVGRSPSMRSGWCWCLLALVLCTIFLPARTNESPTLAREQSSQPPLTLSRNGYLRSEVTGTHSQYAAPGRHIILHCKAPITAHSVISTVWLIREEVITQRSRHLASTIWQTLRSRHSLQTSALHLHGITSNCSGMYRCYQTCVDTSGNYFLSEGHKVVSIVSRDDYIGRNRLERSAYLDMAYGPVTVREGSTFKLQCHGTSSGLVFWDKDNKTFRPSNGRVKVNHVVGSVTFDGAQLDDTGLYQCRVSNQVLTRTQTFQLTVVPVSQQDGVPAVPIKTIVHGPSSVRTGQSATYSCFMFGVGDSEYNVSWQAADGYTMQDAGQGQVTLHNSNASFGQETPLSCSVAEQAGEERLLSWATRTIKSQPELLPRPRIVRYKQVKHFLRIKASRSTPESVRSRVIGISFQLSTSHWAWNQTLLLAFDEIAGKKVFFTELVHDRIELLQHLFESELTIKVAFLDRYGPGLWLTTKVNISTVPIAPTYITASLVPSQPNAVRLQWEYPGVANRTLTLSKAHLSQLHLSVKYNNLASPDDFNVWHTAIDNELVDMSTSRSITLHNIPAGGVYRFRIWWSKNGKRASLPLRAHNLVSLLQADIRKRETASMCVLFAINANLPCPVHNGSSVTSRVSAHFHAHLNSLCTDCYFESLPLSDLPFHVGSCTGTQTVARYQVLLRTRVKRFTSRPVCEVLSDIKERFVRDFRSSQAVVKDVGVLKISTVCAECQGNHSLLLTCLQGVRPYSVQGWYISQNRRDPTAATCPGAA